MKNLRRSAVAKNKTILVYGRHAQETKIIEKNVPTLRRMGYQVFKVPANFTRLSDRSAKDRNEYNRFLSKEFKGRKVIDLHTSPEGFDSFFPLKFKKNVVGLEIPSHKLDETQAWAFKYVIRGAFKKHVIKLHGRTTSRARD